MIRGEALDLRPFYVTWGWLYRHLPPGRHWWTKAQLQTLGVRWPPSPGCIKARIGQPLTSHQKDRFEALAVESQPRIRRQRRLDFHHDAA